MLQCIVMQECVPMPACVALLRCTCSVPGAKLARLVMVAK